MLYATRYTLYAIHYAKQTQFQKKSNERKYLYYNRIRKNGHLAEREKQTQSNPIKTNQSQNKPDQTQFRTGRRLIDYINSIYYYGIRRKNNYCPVEVTGAWWCSWSSKPVRGREGPGWVRFPFASAIFSMTSRVFRKKSAFFGKSIFSGKIRNIFAIFASYHMNRVVYRQSRIRQEDLKTARSW